MMFYILPKGTCMEYVCCLKIMDFLCVSACFFPFEAESAFITGMQFECKTVKIKKKYIN